MSPLWVSVLRGAGRARTGLVVLSTAVASGLLLVAASYARLGAPGEDRYNYGYPHGDAPLLGPIADPGTRGGAIFTVVLVVVPVLLLLDQCVRLGAAVQRQRYQALAIAGATRRDLRRWGAVETGVPAAAGALAGVAIWLLLREVLGELPARGGVATLVPTVTGPGWWLALVVASVAGYGILAGRRAAVRATADLRRDPQQPRPWGPVILLVAAALLVVTVLHYSVVLFIAAIAVGLVGIMATTPWLAYLLSGRVVGRTGSAAKLLASRRIRADHGAAGRAAAAVGAVGLAVGVLGVYLGDLAADAGSYADQADYLIPALLVAVLVVLVLGIITFSLALHSIEATLARRRETAALIAVGVPLATLDAAIQAECRLVTLPVTVGGAVLGVLVYQPLGFGPQQVLGGLIAIIAAAGAVHLAVHLATRVTRPWLHQAAAVTNLHTD